MKKFVAAVVVAIAMISSIQAGPFGLIRRSNGGNNNNTQTNQQTTYYDNGELFSAQGVANRMARILRMGHLGNPTGGYEGVGMGGSPQAAISNCCFYGKRPLRDSGVAQGANGMWYACCRYN
jgi:hypothetical protein